MELRQSRLGETGREHLTHKGIIVALERHDLAEVHQVVKRVL